MCWSASPIQAAGLNVFFYSWHARGSALRLARRSVPPHLRICLGLSGFFKTASGLSNWIIDGSVTFVLKKK
jgi:hypothetical protein